MGGTIMNLHPHRFFITCALVFAMLAAAAGAAGAEVCGRVEKMTESVAAMRSGHETPLAEGDEVQNGDTIQTGPMGYAEIKLIDDTLIAMGGNSAIILDDVQFNVKKARLYVTVKGGGVWASIGSIGLKDPNGVKFVTPTLYVSSANATIQFNAGGGSEELLVQWIPKGGRVSVYNARSKKRLEIDKPDMTLHVAGGVMELAPTEAPDIAEEEPE
jgi:hypothetical protein